jgi:hypothetical protein
MKPVPREAENRTAAMLNEYLFTPLGLPYVHRQPVIGRTGPDITLNEFKLVVDSKSRKRVPICIWGQPRKRITTYTRPVWMLIDDVLLAVPMNRITWINEEPRIVFHSETKEIADYYNHMDAWRKAECPDGITALALRKPGMGGKMTLFVIGLSQVELFRERYLCLKK